MLLDSEYRYCDVSESYEPGLKFVEHISYVTSKAYRILGFIIQSTNAFTNIGFIIHLYRTLVLPHFTYYSLIWTPYLQYNMKRIESLKHKFLSYISYKMRCPLSTYNHNYYHIASASGIYTIASLHRFYEIVFFHGILNDRIKCPAISAELSTRNLSYQLGNSQILTESIH